jgi:hypothetical protein
MTAAIAGFCGWQSVSGTPEFEGLLDFARSVDRSLTVLPASR